MKQLLYISWIIILAVSCKSPSKLVEQGNYDKAIERSIKKMLKGNAKVEDKIMLDKAYSLANKEDENSIKLLKTEGSPANWEKIYFRYQSLDNRQSEVQKVLPFEIKGKSYNYKQVDYTGSIAEAKTKAADYFYATGKKLMERNNKNAYREAYHNLSKAKKYRENAFPDIYELMEESKYEGTSRVLVEVSNYSEIQFGYDFYDELLLLTPSDYESVWVDYYIGRTDRTLKYDYIVNVELLGVYFSPEQFTTKEIIREKRIRDGFTYELDSRGNVKKDTLGNDIKVPKYKIIRCRLIEREQSKEVTIEANIKYLKTNPREIIKSEPIAGTSIFSHFSAKAVGNIRALSPEDINLLNSDPQPFPDDISMMYDCLVPLKVSIEDILEENKNLID